MTTLYALLGILIALNIVSNIYVLIDMKKEGVTWRYYVYEAQERKIGRILMRIFYWIPTMFC